MSSAASADARLLFDDTRGENLLSLRLGRAELSRQPERERSRNRADVEPGETPSRCPPRVVEWNCDKLLVLSYAQSTLGTLLLQRKRGSVQGISTRPGGFEPPTRGLEVPPAQVQRKAREPRQRAAAHAVRRARARVQPGAERVDRIR